jgi:DNA repair exonuclease SbcCD ATPase subunit
MTPPIPEHNIHRDIGALQATVAMLAESMKAQAELYNKMLTQQHTQYTQAVDEFKAMVSSAENKIESLKKEIADMRSLIDQAKGGWRIIVGVGTISAAMGAVIAKIASFVWSIPKL